MEYLSLTQSLKLAIIVIAIVSVISLVTSTGCGDSNVAGIQNTESKISASGNKFNQFYDSTSIMLDMNLKFKKETLSDSKYLESNTGNGFNHIVSISHDLKPDQVLDLQELQPYGIFGLYLSSDDLFLLTNSDGLAITAKTILLEKCGYIDLKLRNTSAKSVHITGFVAGE